MIASQETLFHRKRFEINRWQKIEIGVSSCHQSSERRSLYLHSAYTSSSHQRHLLDSLDRFGSVFHFHYMPVEEGTEPASTSCTEKQSASVIPHKAASCHGFARCRVCEDVRVVAICISMGKTASRSIYVRLSTFWIPIPRENISERSAVSMMMAYYGGQPFTYRCVRLRLDA